MTSPRSSPPTLGKRKRGFSTSTDDLVTSPRLELETDEPVLSHAARRREKKRSQVRETDEEGPHAKKRQRNGSNNNSLERDTAKASKRQNSVWVGNLSFKSTQTSLMEFFRDVGEVTRIHMPTKKAHGRDTERENQGFAYIDFATNEAKVLAITLSEKNLDGRRLLIKDGNDFSGRPTEPTNTLTNNTSNPPDGSKKSKVGQKVLDGQKQPPGPTLFFGNLGFEATEHSLRSMLEAHRPQVKGSRPDEDVPDSIGGDYIRKVRMGTFEDSGNCKGWAFVDFVTPEHATAALVNPHNHRLDGRNLKVEYASPEAVRRGGGAPPINRSRNSHRPQKRERERLTTNTNVLEDDVDTLSKTSNQASRADRGRDSKPKRMPTYVVQRGKRPKAGEEVMPNKASRVRPKPGAALALAKRESVAIVIGQGQKIKFS